MVLLCKDATLLALFAFKRSILIEKYHPPDRISTDKSVAYREGGFGLFNPPPEILKISVESSIT